MFGLLAVAVLSIQLVGACPITFLNDGKMKVLIHDPKTNKKYYADAGKSVNIPGAVAEEPTLWIYVETVPRTNTYKAVYGIVEEECMPEGSPAATLKWSKLENMASTFEPQDGLRIVRLENPDVAPEITYQDLRSSY